MQAFVVEGGIVSRRQRQPVPRHAQGIARDTQVLRSAHGGGPGGRRAPPCQVPCSRAPPVESVTAERPLVERLRLLGTDLRRRQRGRAV